MNRIARIPRGPSATNSCPTGDSMMPTRASGRRSRATARSNRRRPSVSTASMPRSSSASRSISSSNSSMSRSMLIASPQFLQLAQRLINAGTRALFGASQRRANFRVVETDDLSHHESLSLLAGKIRDRAAQVERTRRMIRMIRLMLRNTVECVRIGLGCDDARVARIVARAIAAQVRRDLEQPWANSGLGIELRVRAISAQKRLLKKVERILAVARHAHE